MATQIGNDLGGKVAVITGASSGIGAASAKLFAAAGARVVVGYNRGVERANAVVAGLAGSGHKAIHLPLEDTAQIRKVAAAAISSSVRPGTKPVRTSPGATTITRISGPSTRASAMLIVLSAALEAP